ncbi:hypothetical protein BC332_13018 [Capsicum chinense]|nr:hypothetical protein BC332_13018 [Capsicum chinense]
MDSLSSSYELLSTKLDGSNFALWKFHFGIFVQGENTHRETRMFAPFMLACSCSGWNKIKFLGKIFLREVKPTLDVALAAVLHEETKLGTQSTMESTPLPSIALFAGKSTTVVSTGNTKRSVQCYECQDFGHIAANCLKKKNICAYCKITGHHILDCHHHPNHS